MPLTALSILMFYILHLTKPNQINYAVFRGVSTCLNTFFLFAESYFFQSAYHSLRVERFTKHGDFCNNDKRNHSKATPTVNAHREVACASFVETAA